MFLFERPRTRGWRTVIIVGGGRPPGVQCTGDSNYEGEGLLFP